MTRVCVRFRMHNCSRLWGAGANEVLTVPLDLMEQDSEMQKALQGMDSYESGSIPRHRHNSTPALKNSAGPTPRPKPHGVSSPRPLSWSSHSRSHSTHNLPQPPMRRGSEDLDQSCTPFFLLTVSAIRVLISVQLRKLVPPAQVRLCPSEIVSRVRFPYKIVF